LKSTESKKNWIDRIAFDYLLRLAALPGKNGDALHLLDDKEIAEIRKVERKTYIWAGILGVLGVVLLYIPQYIWPTFFADSIITLPFLEKEVSVPITSTLFGIILLYPELYGLSYFNILAVYKIAVICGFPDKNDPKFKQHVEALMRVGLEKEDRTAYTLGINPLQGASKVSIILFLIINRLKATLSNIIIKLVVRRIMGRAVIRSVVDMMGIPVYAFWNAWASYMVINETKTRIMAPNIIRHYVSVLKAEQEQNPAFREMIYDVLQFIAISKRKYHQNHLLLAEEVLNAFAIEVKTLHEISPDFETRLSNADTLTRKGANQLLLLGFVIDGSISIAERFNTERLFKRKILPVNANALDKACKQFLSGRGITELMAKAGEVSA
jgi:hypothetical protein